MTSVAQSITNAIHDKIMNDVLGPFMEETNERLKRLEKDMAELVDLFIKGPEDEEPEVKENRGKKKNRRTNKELEETLGRVDVIERPIHCVTPLGVRPRNASIVMEDGAKYGMTLPHAFNEVQVSARDLLTCTALINRENKKLLMLREVTIEPDCIPMRQKKLF